MHYHVIRHDYNMRTDQPMDPVGVGIRPDYRSAAALAIQDEKQFRTPAAQRWITHRWSYSSCSIDAHISEPYE